MAWWRRDPCLWARLTTHRYAQRVLRDHEAALRTRCFSRSPSNTAQHQDHDNEKRPDGMTDQEWIQLQRYRRWRKILQEHPYKGLFGASEDMLRGKGLTDWEWVYKTFPKWMLQEMDPQEPVDKDKSAGKCSSGRIRFSVTCLGTDGKLGRRYDARTDERIQATDQPSVERKPTFAQPIIRTTHYERDEFGIVSPSDLRRPVDVSHVKVVGKREDHNVPVPGFKDTISCDSDSAHLKTSNPSSGNPEVAKTQHSQAAIESQDAAIAAKEVSNRESSFIDAFFADEPKAYDRDLGSSKSWRQTALQRRNAFNVTARPMADSFSSTQLGTAGTKVTPPAQDTIKIPSSQALVDNYPYPSLIPATEAVAVEKTLEPTGEEVKQNHTVPAYSNRDVGDPVSTQSSSDKLRKLPEDDIDFLSADEIRAAMGRRTSVIKTSEEKEQDRKKLETGFASTKPKALDDAVEGHVLNNYYVRRTQQELERAQTATEVHEVEGAEALQSSPKSQSAPVEMESSIDRMRRWIEEGGNSLAKHFWQDPIEAGAPSEADMQFAKQMAGLAKGRHAREHISDDLETDLPMCKGLLERLKNDEKRVEHAVYLLRSPRKAAHGAEISKNLRTIRERRLRNTYERTEKQFESACQSLRDLETGTVQKATNAFKRRLGIASRILHKNHTLTRMLTWSAQARLDEPDLERSKAELYSEILTRLATLRDTQLALARLMDHAVQIYGVSLKPADEALSQPTSTSELETNEAVSGADPSLSKTAGAKFLADTAAAARLTDEIQSQKAAMQGLSDDGYARAPKHMTRRPFEEKNPLAHSLFRPFNLQLESLGKKTDGEEAADNLKEAFKREVGDKKLVQEVRSAYEDVYGPITVEHRQVAETGESVKPENKESEAFEMLNEDPLILEATTLPGEAHSAQAATASETSEKASAINRADETHETTMSSPIHDAISDGPPATTLASAAATAEVVNEVQQITSTSEGITVESNTRGTETAGAEGSAEDLPTHYTILIHDPQTDTLSITTSTSGPPRDTSPALPIHQALSMLKAPAKFIPYITSGLEVVTAKRHMLVLRDALDETCSTRGFETISSQSSTDTASEPFSSQVNPIDGTSRLSPTGYSGVEQSQEQLEKDFEERRQAAAATEAARSKKSKQQVRDEQVPKKQRGGVGGVVKTAIWASALCYIVGVTAELVR
ncbi:hypothetical protein SVAN01_04607 [Stagonosporopsis vannaccii]|nr:hypothetical protein SVAN01_04607 [Stagonosporopsis vannaccii]